MLLRDSRNHIARTLLAVSLLAANATGAAAQVYRVSRVTVDSATNTTMNAIGVLLATKTVGVLALSPTLGDAPFGQTTITPIDRWTTNAAGDLVLVAGGVTYDGTRRDDGGFLITESKSPVGRGVFLNGEPVAIPRSRNDGLFAARVRTTYERDGRESPTPSDWTGDAAIAFVDGQVYVHLRLTNSIGGSTGLFASGPFENSAFDLASPTGDRRLKGTLRAGVLVAEWTDRRDNGATFTGILRAERK